MERSYYKIPAEFIAQLGLTDQLKAFPDGRYLCTEVVMSRIHRDIERALEITGGIRITLDQARDEQMGLTVNRLPCDAEPEAAPLYSDEEPQGGDQDAEQDAEVGSEEGGER